ncbi:unnamed protein product [Staurois parvus]|uniref:G-protein coupled receptors family 1 profile domain-containing protein n=1 Tax=Staurois parvus TaxID=386267 RepID=A0ABN9C3A2_9NEOB|nr:unnamed protein product [Staurois parvus]
MGIILNSLALYVFCFQTKVRTPSVIYTINLVVTDLLVGLSLPARIVMYYRNVETCYICYYVHSFTYSVNMYCSILFLTCICVDRYLAIVQARASCRWRNPSYAKCICVLIWIFAVIVTFIILTTTINHKHCCFFQLLMLTGFEYFVSLGDCCFLHPADHVDFVQVNTNEPKPRETGEGGTAPHNGAGHLHSLFHSHSC